MALCQEFRSLAMLKCLAALLAAGILTWAGVRVQEIVSERESRVGPADRSFGMDAADMRTLNDEHSTAPILLPTQLPPGYGWAGLGEEQGDGRDVWARSSQFTSVAGGPVIDVCAKPIAQEAGCEQDDDPYLTRVVGDLKVFISQSSFTDDRELQPETRSFWQHIPMTTDYDKVRWLAK
jgi:hypothetical protein